MMKHRQWLSLFAAGLVLLSLLLFTIHYLIFHDFHHIILYTIHDIAFLPIEVLLVTIVIHSLLERQNLQQKLEKLNMVIGAFYSGIGTQLLRTFVRYDPQIVTIRENLMVSSSWDAAAYREYTKNIKQYPFLVEIHQIDLNEVKRILLEHEDFMFRILENPVMLEHESFTEVLRAVFHLTEELKNRDDVSNLPESDLAHLRGDVKRAYSQMTISWLEYMKYLQADYPYLFSLAVRTDPFHEHPDIYVRE
jgi:hypothetical protein